MLYIQPFHFARPEEKLTQQWMSEAIKFYYSQGNHRSLTFGKKIEEIDAYAEGRQDMQPFKKMYKSFARLQEKGVMSPNNLTGGLQISNYLDAIDFEPLGLLVAPLNSVEATIAKMPIEVTVTATDPLADRKRQTDREFLRNKRIYEDDTAGIAQKLGLEKIDLGGIQNSSAGFDELPAGLDPEDQFDMDLFFTLLYKLRPESALETVLMNQTFINKVYNIAKLLTQDQCRYGVAVGRIFFNDTTKLPDIEIEHPSKVYCPESRLQNYEDSEFIFKEVEVTVTELYNYFGSEISSQEELMQILQAYCKANDFSMPRKGAESAFKMRLVFMSLKSTDYENIGWVTNKKGRTRYYFLPSDQQEDAGKKSGVKRRYKQQTYTGYWLYNTDKCYGIRRFEESLRKPGQEAFSHHPFFIYRSQRKSMVELAIGEVKMAQIAYIKLQHTLLKSMPPGHSVDLKHIRAALEGFADSEMPASLDDLLRLIFEDNTVFTDTEDFGNKDINSRAADKIPGGLGKEAEGYYMVIQQAINNIARLTGINDQVTGASPNPEGLVGMQKLLIQQSQNTTYYLVEAKKDMFQHVYMNWAQMLLAVLKEGGEAAEAIRNLIGEEKTAILQSLEQVPLHTYGYRIDVVHRELERQRIEEAINIGLQQQTISQLDAMIVRRIENPKDAIAWLVAREKKALEDRAQMQREEMQARQQEKQIEVQGRLQERQVVAEGNIKAIQAKGQVDMQLQMAAHKLGLDASIFNNQLKSNLQNERAETQKEKAIIQQQIKQSLERQTP